MNRVQLDCAQKEKKNLKKQLHKKYKFERAMNMIP